MNQFLSCAILCLDGDFGIKQVVYGLKTVNIYMIIVANQPDSLVLDEI